MAKSVSIPEVVDSLVSVDASLTTVVEPVTAAVSISHADASDGDGTDSALCLWKAMGFEQPQSPWVRIRDAVAETCSAVARPQITRKTGRDLDAARVTEMALEAQLRLERTQDVVFGPDCELGPASCFNWALGGGTLGFNEDSWPEALFDWVSVRERSMYPWRSEGRPWKTISLVCVQRRCAKTLAFMNKDDLNELDQICEEHLTRVSQLTREQWSNDATAAALERTVCEQVMTLAVRIAGMTPCEYSDSAIGVAMRGKPGLPPNFCHWWLEIPTGRMSSTSVGAHGKRTSGVERVSCETYPGAPVYFTPCYTGRVASHGKHDHAAAVTRWTRPRGHAVVYVKDLLPAHLAGIEQALVGRG